MKWDFFISHASEDKNDIARPLADMLEELGFSVWLDENQLNVGDSLVDKISQGIANSRYGIIILSKSFFNKKWTKTELNSIFSIEISSDDNKLLPIWHGINKAIIDEHVPLLSDRLSLNTDDGLIHVAEQLSKVADKQDKLILDTKVSSSPKLLRVMMISGV